MLIMPRCHRRFFIHRGAIVIRFASVNNDNKRRFENEITKRRWNLDLNET